MHGCEITLLLRNDFAAFLHSAVDFPLKFPDTLEAEHRKLKANFAALCKILPSTWSDLLAMAVTPSFQLRIMHRLNHWIVDFMSFEMVYIM